MIALDSSVVIASFGAWHEHHELARSTLAERPQLPAHAALEAYSVLTRLPDPFRTEPTMAAEFLERTFTAPQLMLAKHEQGKLPGRLARLGISGGAAYDALIAFTAADVGAELLTLDRRAWTVYERCKIRARLLS